MSVEDFSVAAAVSWLTTIECRFENLLPNSSLTCLDFSSALDAHAGAADNHFLPPVPSFTSSPTYAETGARARAILQISLLRRQDTLANQSWSALAKGIPTTFRS